MRKPSAALRQAGAVILGKDRLHGAGRLCAGKKPPTRVIPSRFARRIVQRFGGGRRGGNGAGGRRHAKPTGRSSARRDIVVSLGSSRPRAPSPIPESSVNVRRWTRSGCSPRRSQGRRAHRRGADGWCAGISRGPLARPLCRWAEAGLRAFAGMGFGRAFGAGGIFRPSPGAWGPVVEGRRFAERVSTVPWKTHRAIMLSEMANNYRSYYARGAGPSEPDAARHDRAGGAKFARSTIWLPVMPCRGLIGAFAPLFETFDAILDPGHHGRGPERVGIDRKPDLLHDLDPVRLARDHLAAAQGGPRGCRWACSLSGRVAADAALFAGRPVACGKTPHRRAGRQIVPFIESQGVRLYYEEAGSGTPVLFAHEFGGDMRSWEPQMRFLSRYFRCIAFNARGYPPSDVPSDPRRLQPGDRGRRRGSPAGRARA